MRIDRERIGVVLLVAALAGCGGSIKGNGSDGSIPAGACASLGACDCYAAADRCAMQTESCWCASACDPNIACVCGGGRFLGCEEKSLFAGCTTALAAAKTKCPDHAPGTDDLCSTAADPSCVAACLANFNSTGSCAELGCSCEVVCECIPPAPSPNPLVNCISACNLPPPPLR
jgi:hypothetical protein